MGQLPSFLGERNQETVQAFAIERLQLNCVGRLVEWNAHEADV